MERVDADDDRCGGRSQRGLLIGSEIVDQGRDNSRVRLYKRSNRPRAEGLKEGIGCMPMDGRVDWIDEKTNTAATSIGGLMQVAKTKRNEDRRECVPATEERRIRESVPDR